MRSYFLSNSTSFLHIIISPSDTSPIISDFISIKSPLVFVNEVFLCSRHATMISSMVETEKGTPGSSGLPGTVWRTDKLLIYSRLKSLTHRPVSGSFFSCSFRVFTLSWNWGKWATSVMRSRVRSWKTMISWSLVSRISNSARSPSSRAPKMASFVFSGNLAQSPRWQMTW